MMKQFLFTALVLTAPLFGEDSKPDPVCQILSESSAEALQKNGFVSLIKGSTLDGWSIKGSKAQFSIKNGEIMGKAVNLKGNSFLCTDQLYSDFIYTFEFKFDHLKGNSGCMFRGLVKSNKVYGYQCEGDNTVRSWTAGLYDEGRRQWMFPQKSKTEKDEHHRAAFTEQGLRLTNMNGWNRITIKCVGKHIQTWLNGELRVDLVDHDPKHFTPKGFFGLQVHSGKSCDVRWRNIYIKELK